MNPHRSIQQKIIFDAVVIVLAAVLLALAWPSASVPVARERPPVFLGVYIIYLGVLFLLSYFYSETSFVLSALRWICEHFTHPRGRHMAFFYFALSLLLGICALCAAFGWIGWGR
jgi:hypothetical protein